MTDKRDYYEVLGVEKSASTGDLKNAFRRLARKYHPDRSTEEDAEDRFKEIQEAYAVLSDDQKRAHYDRFGHDGHRVLPSEDSEGASTSILRTSSVATFSLPSSVGVPGEDNNDEATISCFVIRLTSKMYTWAANKRSCLICPSRVQHAMALVQRVENSRRAPLVLGKVKFVSVNKLVPSSRNLFKPVRTAVAVAR